jgi:lipopolysaccharide transport system ATP-binding protein
VANERLAFVNVSVVGTPPVQLCVDLEAGEPFIAALMGSDRISQPVQRAFLDLVTPGSRVLDLGSWLGTFSLPAAAAGATVVAVDAVATHVRLLRAAAERNGFERLHVVHGAVSDTGRPVPIGGHGSISRVLEPGAVGATTVEPLEVDALLEEQGWDGVDLVKIDIEGAEVAALNTMRRLFASGARPTVVFECHGEALPLQGSSTRELRARFVELGYELLLVDHRRPGVLVESGPDLVQPECVSDYIAVTSRSEALAGWVIERPFSREQTVSRLLDQAAHDAQPYRYYAADLIANGPAWLRADSLAATGVRALELDIDRGVRGVLARGEHPAGEPEAPRSEIPADLVVLAQDVSLQAPTARLEQAPGGDARPGRLVLGAASFHVRRGQSLGILADDLHAASLLLRAVAGHARPAGGMLHVAAPVSLLASVGDVLESDLTVAENIGLLAAFLGGDLPDVNRRMAQIADLAGVQGALDVRLGDASAATAVRLALTTAFEGPSDGCLCVDVLPAIDDPAFRDRVRRRAAEFVGAGGSIVQAVTDPAQLLAPADRMLWLSEGEVVAGGHTESIVDAARGRQLGLRPTVADVR